MNALGKALSVLSSVVPCNDGDVRLLEVDDNPTTMIVELCQNGNYSTLCYQSWGNEEASVVCSQLDFSSTG